MEREISLIFYLYNAYFFHYLFARFIVNKLYFCNFFLRKNNMKRRNYRYYCICIVVSMRFSKYTEFRALLNELHFRRRSQISRRWWLIVNIILSWIECSYRLHVIVDFSPRQALRDERESHYLPTISINIIPFNELCLMKKSFSVKSANITRFLINVLIIIHLFERNISSSGTLESDR